MLVKPLRFAMVFFGTGLVLMLVSWALARVVGAGVPFGAIAILPPICAALVEGTQYGRATGQVMPSGPAWRDAAILTVLVAAMNAVLLLPLLNFEALRSGEVQLPWATLAMFGLGFLAVVFLVIRLFLFFGSRNAVLAGQRPDR